MKPLSLYIHIPFCRRKCLFCSFVVAVGHDHWQEDYIKAVISEMKMYQSTCVDTLYLGGGTPSLLAEDLLEALMEAIHKNFHIMPSAEKTIEANPDTIDQAKAAFLKDLGFNRISLGVQSMNDVYLKFLGRSHDARGAQEAYHVLRQAGFTNINLDLMYAFPGQTQKELEEDVRAIALLNSEHLSLYTLTIEPHSRFYATAMKLDDDEKLSQQYLLVSRLLQEHGLGQYEISNFARCGFESRHNINYWTCGRYIGLGVGAHGFLGNRRYWNTSNLQHYMQKAHTQDIVEGYEDLSVETQASEKLLFGLRMSRGVLWQEVAESKRPTIQQFIDDGFLIKDEGFLKATPKGRLVLDELSSRLI